MATPVRADESGSALGQGLEAKKETQVEAPVAPSSGSAEPPKPTPQPAKKKKTRQELNDLKIMQQKHGWNIWEI